jgi:hypothetical protein
VRAGSGLNAVTRAIDVGFFMGFEIITVLGADCAIQLKAPMPANLQLGSRARLDWLRANTIMHADGGHALASRATPMTLGGEVDAGTPDERIRPGHGRHWETKPDMIISAKWLLHMQRKSRGRLRLIGDTFPNALKNKSKAYLKKLPALVDGDGNVMEEGT